MEEEIKAEIVWGDLQKGDASSLLAQVKLEKELGWKHIQGKNGRKLEERKLYVQEAEKDKINIHSIYLRMQMLLALYYQDKPVIQFKGRSIFTEQLAENISKVANFDAEQMDLDTIDYDVEFDRFYVGVGVKALEGWDNILKCGKARHIDALSVIPDPNGWYRAKSHRFIGFNMTMTREDMEARGYKNIDQAGDISVEQRKRDQAYANARGYNSWSADGALASTYFHFCQYEGFRYLVVTSGDCTAILDIVWLEPETDEEKKNPLLVPYPITFKYFSPMPHDFYGISVVDLLKDKQTRFSRLFNLEYMKAVRQVLGEDKLYDPNKIKNIRDLGKPEPEPRYIEANIEPGESLEGAIVSVPRESSTNDASNMRQEIGNQMTESIGLDQNTLWVGADQTRTKGEAQMIQQNANLRLGLITKFSNWGDEDFWRLYYRSLQVNLSGEKVVRLTRSFGDYYVNFKREDIVGTTSIDIKITTISEIDAQRAKESATFFATFATDLATATSEFSKNFIMRKKYRLQGWEPDEIRLVVRDTSDEILARQDVERLNYGLDILPIEPDQDHWCYLAYYESAIDSEKTRKAIEKRKQALIMFSQNRKQGTSQAQDGLLQSQANSSASQLTTQSLQGMKEQQGNNITATPSSPQS